MSSPVSAILANLVMEHVEERALSTEPHPPKWWYKYVDDSHVCLAREHLTKFHSHLTRLTSTSNSQSKKRVIDPSHSSTRRQLEILMDQLKPMFTEKQPIPTSISISTLTHHPLQHKRSVVRTLLDRAKNIPSTDEDKKS